VYNVKSRKSYKVFLLTGLESVWQTTGRRKKKKGMKAEILKTEQEYNEACERIYTFSR